MTTVSDSTSIPMMAADAVTTEPLAGAKKRGLLPVLVALFVFSYCLMTALIVFQGSTIQSQRALILDLLADSRQLWANKGKALLDKQPAHRHAQTPSSQDKAPSTQAPMIQTPMTQAPMIQTPMTQAPMIQTPMTQAPTTRTPMNQAPSIQAPSTQAVPQHRSQQHVGKALKPKIQLPPQPAADPGDQRRVLFTI